ncbi:Chab-2 [Hemileuca sp. nucleopolyhedrovirus]|uniref:Chab-2 n=1 Tax=Hemileuca sp. nucleopolyhedrovirus TaxID=1367203 RepID=S5N367_9ABAC|nr:Chab-2 [Hemileuca sp. nucleopolyhedrovirus]AGR56800.1 Chab-2 [Hemileuca sp. nucleopolyhedrovirus]
MITFSDLPKSTLSLPYHGKRIFLKFYTKSIQLCMSKKAASRIAWKAVKRKYYKTPNGTWKPYDDSNSFDTTCTSSDNNTCSSNSSSTNSCDDNDNDLC